MFAKKYRLPRSQKFIHAQVIHSSLFVCKIVPNALAYNRYGFVVSKKIDKRATVRNRQKRVFRAALEQRHAQLSAGNDFLFILKPSSKNVSAEVVQKELQKLR